ncbi:MAG TPA: ABC transporter ATP-binding protein [Pseudomonadales bacterium]
MNILEVRHLGKQFGDLIAVDDISFAVRRGSCFGLLGPNGAGKTTTIEMIEGICEPDRGEILYHGRPRDRRFKQQAGIQFQQTALMDYLTVGETLALFASFYPAPVALDELTALCQLQGFVDRQSTRLSGGQRQRLLLALALINNPDIIFLDEPTTGLDPQARRSFWTLIESIRQQGKTIILTTHYMDEAEKLCDELLIIDRGRIIEQGSPQALLNRHFSERRLTLDKAALVLPAGALAETVIDEGEQVSLLTDDVRRTIARLLEHGVDLGSLTIAKPNLEDLFLKLTGHELRQ